MARTTVIASATSATADQALHVDLALVELAAAPHEAADEAQFLGAVAMQGRKDLLEGRVEVGQRLGGCRARHEPIVVGGTATQVAGREEMIEDALAARGRDMATCRDLFRGRSVGVGDDSEAAELDAVEA